jgi:hypothetical protein
MDCYSIFYFFGFVRNPVCYAAAAAAVCFLKRQTAHL